MALTLGTAGGNKTVTGVYQGQGSNAINIGTTAQTFGGTDKPLVVGFSRLDDTNINIKAYFDPSLSPIAKEEPWGQIGFIQVGEFRITGLPTPVKIQDKNALYPVYDKFQTNGLPKFLKWVNVPRTFGNPAVKLLFPDYPLWAVIDKPGLSWPQLFKYPQEFGGYTSYNPEGIVRKAGDNLCAYLNLDVDVTLNNLPFDSVSRTYFNTLDFNDLNKEIVIPSEVQFQPSYVLNYLTMNGIVPFLSQIRRVTKLDGKTYFLIEYNDAFQRRRPNAKLNLLKTYGAAWKDAEGAYFTLLDEDLLDEWNESEAIYGRPDLAGINDKLLSSYGYNLNGLNLENFRLSFQYYTYACAINIDSSSKTYSLDLFEGFGLEITRQYNYVISGNEEWLPAGFHTFELKEPMKKEFLKTIEIFFQNQNSEYDLVTPLIF